MLLCITANMQAQQKMERYSGCVVIKTDTLSKFDEKMRILEHKALQLDSLCGNYVQLTTHQVRKARSFKKFSKKIKNPDLRMANMK